ncbi:MAG: hypothetical protein HYZ20_12785, partial [Burkholderiales bacterium]|nr:hypothetical protein [Burkholderiales bacterium]
RLALAAARGQPPPDAAATARALRADTLREHLRRIVLDWPAALAGETPSAAELQTLRDGPAFAAEASSGEPEAAEPAGSDEAALRAHRWIERELLGDDAAGWLAAWDRDADSALDAWTARAPTPTARRLRACRDAARAIRQPVRRLAIAGDADALAAIAAALRADPAFALAPRAEGDAFESGCWARAADPAPERHPDAWLRLGARLAEVVRLALPAGDAGAPGALRFGALALAADRRPAAPGHQVGQGAGCVRAATGAASADGSPEAARGLGAATGACGEGLGWCEMARGLLLHRIRLDRDGDRWRVAECDVLAPTEWHFHPHGPVAQALARLPRDGSKAGVRLLAAAFDPCVAVRVEAGDA